MKHLFFITTLFVSLSAFSSPKQIVSGRIGKMVLDAMKSADVKATSCKDGSCSYIITDFYAADETDGCGGGTTSYDASFKYSDKSDYTFRYCEGSRGDGGDDPRKAGQNKAQELVNVFSELGLFETAGWTSSVSLAKVECMTYKNDRNATCILSPTKESK